MAEEENLIRFVKDNYVKKFGSLDGFEENWKIYQSIPAFKANENIHEIYTDYSKQDAIADKEASWVDHESMKPEVHWILRSATQYYLTKAFEAMKIDLNDPNVAVNALGKGTPGRIAKMWVGNDPEDTTELGSGRFNKEPFISRFPNDGQNDIIIKEVDIVSCCSHHFLPFSTLDSSNGTSRCIIAYKPNNYVLGISKLQRYVTWCSRRFWLQEDLTKYIGATIARIANTKDVYIRIEGAVHNCEKYRGANSRNGNLTTEFRSGIFKSQTPNYK